MGNGAENPQSGQRRELEVVESGRYHRKEKPQSERRSKEYFARGSGERAHGISQEVENFIILQSNSVINELSQRNIKARVVGRIPDLFIHIWAGGNDKPKIFSLEEAGRYVERLRMQNGVPHEQTVSRVREQADRRVPISKKVSRREEYRQEQTSHEDPNRVKEKVYRTRIVALREELEKINNAVHDRTYEILRDSLFPGLTFTVSDRDALIEQEVRQRESELRNIESLLQRLSMEGNSSASVPQPPSQEREIVEDIGVSPHISEAQPLSSFENVTARSGEESPEESAQSVDVLDVNPHTENHTSFSPETKTTTPPSREEKVPAFDSRQAVLDVRFEHTFDISRTELETIEGFKSLSIPQQKLLYENFLQLTLGSVREDVAQLHAEHVGARAQEHMRRYGEKLGAVISGLQEAFTGTYKKLGAEKKQAHAMKTGGFETHKKLLTDLIHGMAAYGPRVHENIDGELMVDLVQIRARAQGKETRDAEWFAMNELNIVAHAYARIPSTWGEYTLGVDTEQDSRVGRFVREKILRQKGRVEQEDHKLAFETAHSRYEKAKGALEQVMRRSGKRDDEIAEMLMGIDMRVHQLQTLQTDPDALKALDEISHKNLFFESAKQMFSSSQVGYFALGFAGRSLLGSTFMGYMGAPMVSGAVASMRSWDKTAAELRERDRNARKGVVDGKEGALNIVIADHLISQTERLIAQYRNATYDAERSKLLSSIQARATYIHDKQTLNRINYGNREGMVTKQVRLAEVLGEAMAIVSAEEIIAEQDSTKKRAETIRERLARKLDATEEQITHVRRVYRDREKTRSIGKAVAISLAGTFVSHAIHAQETKDAVTLSGKPLKPEVPTGENNVVREDPNVLSRLSEVPPQHTALPTFDKSLEQEKPTVLTTEVQSNTVPEIHTAEQVYVIQEGDTLTDIMKERVTAIKNLKTPFAQDNAIANILKSLKPEELSRIGIRSGDVDMIYSGDTLNLNELHKIVEERASYIERAASRFGGYAERTSENIDVNTEHKDLLNKSHEAHSSDTIVTNSESAGAPQSVSNTLEPLPSETEHTSESADKEMDTQIKEIQRPFNNIEPYGKEMPDVVRYRTQETEAFLKKISVMESNWDDARGRSQLRNKVMSSFDTYALAMDKKVPHFSDSGVFTQINGTITADMRIRAAQYLITVLPKEPQIGSPKYILSTSLRKLIQSVEE